MKKLEERILRDGQVLGENILKVDSFLTHQVDFSLMKEIGQVFAEAVKGAGITKIVTIEASGIAVAVPIAQRFHVPVVFAKKAKSKNIGDGVYTSHVHSYTYNKDFTVTVSKDYLNEDDHILIVDDFLANGLAADGLIDIANQSGAKIVGLGICVEKLFQGGGEKLRKQGYRVESLAKIKSFDNNKVNFE